MTVAIATHTNTVAVPGSTSYVVNLPATIASGDLLLVWLCTQNDAVTAIPSGWSQVSGASNTTTQCYLNCYSKTATGSEGATATWTIAFNSQAASVAARVTGWSTVEASHTNTGYGTAPNDSVTTLTDNALVIGVAACVPDGGTATSTPPASWTEYEDVVATSNFRQVSLNAITVASHAAQSGAWTLSVNGYWATSLVSVSAAGGSGSTTTGRLTLGMSGTGTLAIVQNNEQQQVQGNRTLDGSIDVSPYRQSSITITGGAQ